MQPRTPRRSSWRILAECNREALRLWLDKDPRAHNWGPFFRYIVQTLEGKGEEEVAEREEQLRSAIKAVIPCDINNDPPVPPGFEGPYDVVAEMAVLPSACANEAAYIAALVRLSRLLKPGGILISTTFLTEGLPSNATHAYRLGGGKTLSSLNVSEATLREGLEKAGFSLIMNAKLKRSPADPREPAIQQGASFFGSVFFAAVNAK